MNYFGIRKACKTSAHVLLSMATLNGPGDVIETMRGKFGHANKLLE
jgi:hypothetical protein